MKWFKLLILCFLLVSCQNEDMGYSKQDIISARYKTEFVQEFGQPDPNHTWGFEDIPIDTYTRVADPNSNMWTSMGLDVPAPLTDMQKQVVTEWFETSPNPTGIAVSWEDYFAQQVHSNSHGNHMDKLLDAGHNYTDHIYNFNNGNCSETNVDNTHHDRIQYMTGQSTQAFGYHESVGQNTYFDHYVIIPGETIDPSNTYGLHGMYFVGFDYEAYKSWAPNEDRVPRDYYFDDWIIRISPGTYSSKAQRVMCEDLGGLFDWDFNDVVFDAYIEGKGNERYAHITVQCAGGTLPITVGTTDMDYEAHKLFGVSTYTVVINPSAPIQYTIKLHNGEGNTTNVSTIPIYVSGSNIAQDIQRGAVPQRFACPTSVKWSPELTNICETYPKFPSWVGDDANLKNVWYLNPKQ